MALEWYTLDASLRRDKVIEGFQSFIWTERYFAWGDIQIVTISTHDNRDLLKPGTWIGMKDSYRVMKVETVEDTIAEDGTKNITVKGRSLEALLDDRVAMPSFTGLETNPKFSLTDYPQNIAKRLFDYVCVTFWLSANDGIPFYQTGTFLPAGTIPWPDEQVTISFEPATLYNDISKICQMWQLGFRLVKNADLGQVYFDVYTGDNRTSDQEVNRPVIFSTDLESISKTSVLHSIATFKTVAYVFAKNGAMAVYADGYDSSVSGSDRRVLLVNASDITTDAGSQLTADMTQRGKEELAKNREIYAFDGEIGQNSRYVYGTDYNLGDIVEERTADGFANYMLVTEQIFISDGEGERAYPALMLSQGITPGTWLSLPVAEHWDDVPVDLHWDDV